MALLKTILKFLGLSSWTGYGTILVGGLMIMGAAATWLAEDAKSRCDTSWELKLSQESLKLQALAAERGTKITELEAKLKESEEQKQAEALASAKELEKQREKIPLSKACNECRVPNDRIWLRGPKTSTSALSH